MRSGILRHLGTIQQYTATRNAVGEEVETWATFKQAWCEINPLRGSENYISAEKHASATHQIITRYQIGITPKMRLVIRGRTFDIIDVLNVMEKDRMVRMVVEEQI